MADDAVPSTHNCPYRRLVRAPLAGWCWSLWFVATIGVFVASQAMGGIDTQGATNTSGFSRTESAEGDQIWSDANVQSEPGEDFVVVLTGGSRRDEPIQSSRRPWPTLSVACRRRHSRISRYSRRTASSTHSPFRRSSACCPPTAPARGCPARILYHAGATRDPIAELKAAVDGPRQRHPTIEMHAVSRTLINEDINDVVNSDLEHSLVITIPATFVILLIAFGAVAAAVVPLVLALHRAAGRVRHCWASTASWSTRSARMRRSWSC